MASAHLTPSRSGTYPCVPGRAGRHDVSRPQVSCFICSMPVIARHGQTENLRYVSIVPLPVSDYWADLDADRVAFNTSLDLNETGPGCDPQGFGQAPHAQALHHMGTVHLHCARAQPQLKRDRLIRLALCEAIENFSLAGR